MAKDPAFLFYSKDWFEGTAEMMPAEKGVYVDLLCYQHQKGGLPIETERLAKLSRLSHAEFMPIWEGIKEKFKQMDNRLVNRKLADVMKERSDRGAKNKITGTFASVLRLADLSKKQYVHAKKYFKIDDFVNIPTERLTDSLTNWLVECLKSIEDGNENEDANENILEHPFNTESWFSTWDSWIKHRSKIRKPYTDSTAIQEQLTWFKKKSLTEAQSISIINESIRNGYQGLFEKNKTTTNGSTQKHIGSSAAAGQSTNPMADYGALPRPS